MSLGFTQTPWGWFRTLEHGPTWQVKLLHVEAGRRTSLQRHAARSEWWYVLEGEGIVTIAERTFPTGDTAWIHIYQGHQHRLTGVTPHGITIIELQLSPLVGGIRESDITRLEDDYGRTDR